MISSLLLKPQTFARKIKAKNIGYVCSDGTINFQSVKSANKYAKSVVVRALNQDKPFERVVMIEGKRVMKQIDGNGSEVRLRLDPLTMLCDTIVHGHPDMLGKGVTGSFSENDVRTLFSNPFDKVRKIRVYNSAGEASTMKKLAPSKCKGFDYTDEDFNAIRSENMKAQDVIDGISEEVYKIGEKLVEKLSSDDSFFGKFVRGLSYNHFMEDLAAKSSIYANHLALEKIAPKLNVSYKTNFSNLSKNKLSQLEDCIS